MLSLRCKICLETMDNSAIPMASLCGHIYCLDCATFHFSTADPFCAVCRKPQTLEKMIRLYTDTDDGSARDDASAMGEDDQLSLSPVSVRSIERAGEDAAGAVKKAIAGRADMDQALVACNTFVNSVTPRERAHINEELLRDIAFQLTLVQRVLKDNEVQVTRLKEEVQAARAGETKARLRIDQQRRLLKRAEKEQDEAVKGLAALQESYDLLYQQCIVATEDANRTRVRAAKAVNEFEKMEQEMKEWRERAAKATKKYYALKNELKQLKQAAQGPPGPPRRSRPRSDDLEVV